MCKESKLLIHANLRWPSFSFISITFKFTYFRIVDIWTFKKKILLKKINHSHPIFFTNLHNSEALRKLRMQIEIPSCLGHAPKNFNYKATNRTC